MSDSLKILFVASEAVPYAKTGGLADVAGALPKALSRMGHDVRLIIPKYGVIDDKTYNLRKRSDLSGGGALKTSLLSGSAINVMFIENEQYFARWGFYGENGQDYVDNAERFLYFNNAVLESCEKTGWIPDVIHCNDWQTGLIPLFLKLDRYPKLSKVATIITIHNIAYQGFFHNNFMDLAKIPWELYTLDKLEYWSGFSFLKAGILYADIITTVSSKYATEIMDNGEYGRGMEGVIKSRKNDLFGIVNGVDYDQWNPLTDRYLESRYDLMTIERKSTNKLRAMKDLGMAYNEKIPLISMVSRLDEQKGMDLLIESMAELMTLDVQIALLGIGDRKFYPSLKALEEKYRGKLSVNLRFDNPLGHLLYAGSDMFLMPSRFEPCGLSQLIAFKYGTIPVVRATGGLSDTVFDFDPETGRGNGFAFHDYKSWALVEAVKRAVAAFADKRLWAKLVISAMSADYSWDKSARKYSGLYEIAAERKRKEK